MLTLSLNILGLKLDTNLKNGGDKEILKSFYSMQSKLQIIATQFTENERFYNICKDELFTSLYDE